MGASVAKSFESEVAKAFHFLVAEHGLACSTGGEPAQVRYGGVGLHYEIAFDPVARAVTTSLARDIDGVRMTATLPALVLGAALGTAAHVRSGARTLTELRSSVLSQAAYVRRLQPYLTPLNVVPLMRAAHTLEQHATAAPPPA